MLYLKHGDYEFSSQVEARDFHEPGQEVKLAFNVAKGHFFAKDTEKVIR